MLAPYLEDEPSLGVGVFVHVSAQVIGQVQLGDDASVWPQAVLRGDVNRIEVGACSNIQDGAVVHVTHQRPEDPEGAKVVIGHGVTIGHGVMLHGCVIGNYCLIGIGSIVLDRVVIEDEVMIAAGSLVPPNKRLQARSLYMGRPAVRVRALTESEVAHLRYSAEHYVRLKNNYLRLV